MNAGRTVLLGTGCAAWGAVHLAHRWAGLPSMRRHRVGGPGAVPPWFVLALRRAGLSGDAEPAWSVAVVGLCTGVAVVGVHAPLLVAIGVLGGGVLVALHRRPPPSRAVDLLSVVDALAASTRAGASLLQAVEQASTMPGAPAEGLVAVTRHARRGGSIERAFGEWAAAQPHRSAALVGHAVALASRWGAPLGPVLDAVADTLREELAIAAEVRASAVPARASAAVVVVAPLAFAGLAAFADPAVGHVLTATAIGWGCLGLGLGLDLLGALWMRRLVAGVS